MDFKENRKKILEINDLLDAINNEIGNCKDYDKSVKLRQRGIELRTIKDRTYFEEHLKQAMKGGEMNAKNRQTKTK